ncbi:MAG: hypothetical protein J6S71_03035 [Clostridia bacterium]|nr:hypothetical protein [Clostridia bacterium]
MTKAAAIYNFWSSFNLTAYEENSVPTGNDAPTFPYITFSFSSDSFGDEVAMSASLWYRSSSWVECNAKTEEISTRIGRGGVMLSCDGGAIWLKKGQPFAQNMSDDSDSMIKRKYLNLVAEFITE